MYPSCEDPHQPRPACRPLGSLVPTGGPASPPIAAAADADPTIVARLGGLFAQEPELIRAFLEDSRRCGTPDSATVVAAVREALRREPHYADLHYFAAEAAMKAGQVEEARERLQQALEINPRYRDALILAARAAIAQHESDAAFDYLRDALAVGADYADVHLLLGNLWRERGELCLARDEYERALDINPHLTAARTALGTLARPTAEGGDA